MQGAGGVEKDWAKAAQWYRKAAEQGYTWAQSNLGYLYMKGRGVGEDYAEARRWLLAAAEKDNHQAQYNLGALLANGRGGPQDYVEAYKWLTLAHAKKPSESRAYWLGWLEERMTWDETADAKKRAENWRPRSSK